MSDERLKQARSATSIELNIVEQSAIKKWEETEKLLAFDLSYVFGKSFFRWWWFSKYICLLTNI